MAIARFSHATIFALTALLAICVIITSGILVGQNEDAFSSSLRTRCRFLLFCGLWSFVFCIFYVVGTFIAAGNILFSIASHLTWLVLTLILFLSGSAALTSSIRGEHWHHQDRLQILAGFSWTETALLFLAIIVVLTVGTMRGDGIRGSIA